MFIIGSLGVGGAEQFLLCLAQRLASQGEKVAIVSLTPGGAMEPEFRAAGVDVLTIPLSGLSNKAAALWRLALAMGRHRPDVIAGWMYHGCLAGVVGKAFRPGARLIWSIHHTLDHAGGEKRSTFRMVKALAMFRQVPTAIVFCSNRSAATHLQQGFPSEKTRIIANGFDTDQFTPAPTADRLSPRRKSVGHVARFHPMKDHLNFIAAAAVICRDRSDVDFVMVGSGVTYDNDTLSEAVKRLGLESRIQLLGPRRDVQAIMQSLDVLVVSSAWGEAFPIVIGEAMSSGVPCVSTDVGDASMLIGDTGEVVPIRDADALAQAILSILNEGPEQSTARRRRCRERIVSQFSLEEATSAFLALSPRPS